MNVFLPLSWCKDENIFSFIYSWSSNLVLNNVNFTNFRTGFKSILCAGNGSNSSFINVNFDNVKFSEEDNSGIVIDVCKNTNIYSWIFNNAYGNLKFENGVVSRLNNGYEVKDAISLKGFLNIVNISSIVLKNVGFQNNVVFKKSDTATNEASLLYLGKFEFLLIDSCSFEYNYCDLGLINIQQENKNFSIESNDQGEMIYSTLSNIHIYNSNFTSNYGKTAGILYANFKGESQNFLIENSLFARNGIEVGSLILIESDYINEIYLNESVMNLTMPDGNVVQRKYLAKWGKILNSTFNENYSGGSGIIEIIRMINIELKNIDISNNGVTLDTAANINSLILKYYIQNPNIYIGFNLTNPPDLECEFLSSISDSINFKIESANIQKNYCKNSSPTISIANTLNTTIASAYFEQNWGSGSNGICLAFDEDNLIIISDSEFNSNINYESGSAGTISSLSDLFLENCTFYNNTESAIYFVGKNLFIKSSNFDSNSSPNLNGGAIYYQISSLTDKYFQLSISNTTFGNNFGRLNGGAIFIHKDPAIESILSLIIKDSSFHNNQALEGSCIYIDEETLISADSCISDCNFKDNKASFSGTISTYYTYGVLTLIKCDFVNNSGAYSSGFSIANGENNKISDSKIILNFCIFQFNAGIVTISLDNSNINSTLEANNCLFEYNVGSIYGLDNDYVADKNSRYFHNNSPNSGAVLNLKNSAVFRSENATYYNCSSDLNGGVASISTKSIFFCFRCFFTKNYAESSGGVIYSDSDSQFHISDSIINKNMCKNRGSAIFMANCIFNSSIDNTETTENYAYSEGTIALLSSLICVTNSKISNNSAGGDNPGILLEDSNVTIISTTFSDQNGNKGCFILLSMSDIKIINSSFTNGYSYSSGVAIHSTSSTFSLFSSLFFNLFSADGGGTIYLYEASTMHCENVSFINSNMLIDTLSSSLFISNSSFRNYSNTAISGTQMISLSISNSEFSDGSGINGGALYCSQCSEVSINSSYFLNNSAENGGAIYISNHDSTENSQCNITYSSFISNTAGNGAAVWANSINLHISFTNFYENHAESWQTETLQEIKDGIGGAIKIVCENSETLCYFGITSNNFTSNWATYNGGAINWDDSKPEFENNSFWNNSAQYGNDIASFPVMMLFINNTKNRILEDGSMTLNLNSIASGQKTNPILTFASVDDLYQIITTDIESQAQLKSLSDDTIISGTSTAYAANGIYYFDDYVISAKPGTSIQIYVDSSAIDESKSTQIAQTLQMQTQFIINVTMRLCEMGEATVGLECEKCLENYYNLDAKDSKCLDCPSSAICYGNYTMVPKEGYWRDNKLTDRFWKCLFPPACLGSPDAKNISFTGICKEGYESNLCHSCKEGYSRLYKNECQECPNTIINAFRLTGIFTLLVFIAIVIIKTSQKSAFERTFFSSIYIKIFWNYLQIMIIIATFRMNWPYEAFQLFYIQTCVDYIGAQLFSIDCFLQTSYSKSKIYYYKIMITSLTPFSLACACLLILIVIYIIKKKNWREFKDDYISSFTILLFLIHPSIIDTMFSIFSCKEINSGEYWLNVDLGIRCWDANHLFYALLFALPTINIWIVAVPALCLIKLVKNRRTLEEVSTRLRYGFLVNGYSLKYYYWEFLILYHKVILIMVSVFFSNISTNIQAITVTLLLALFFHIQAKNQPYCEIPFNKADIFSRLASLISILAGLFFLTGDLDNISKYILLILLLLANLLFIIHIGTQIFSQFYIIKVAYSLLKRVFSLNKGRKYIVDDIDENLNKVDKDYAPIASQNIKISTAIFSEDANIGNLAEFEKNSNISIEIDPLPSVQSE